MRLIGLLNDAQRKHGYLSKDTLRALAKQAKVPLHRLQQLVSFYPSFRTTPPPRVELGGLPRCVVLPCTMPRVARRS